METIRYHGQEFTVAEVSRPAGWSCRHLRSVDGLHHFLEYLTSAGPYKVDVCAVHQLSSQQIESHASGTLVLGQLARQLAEIKERTEEPR